MINSPPKTSIMNPFVDWLLSKGWDTSTPEALVMQLGVRIAASGISMSSMRIIIRTLHPLTVATHYTWGAQRGELSVFSPPYDAQDNPGYLNSPIASIFDGSDIIRRRLDVAMPKLDFPFLKELKDEGVTDYVAMPLVFKDGAINAITMVSNSPGGFNDDDLENVYGMLKPLARMMEFHAMRQTTRTLLNTYMGEHTGRRVLDGAVRRGDGEIIHAVICFCDLRDSVTLAESMSLEDYLATLNDFFDCTAGAILDHGGEVLRFIGDAVLAIFPFDEKSKMFGDICHSEKSACAWSTAAARDVQSRIKRLNRERREKSQVPLSFALAMHVGDVMYGNIGTAHRLEFTVTGKAANETARLEELCKTLNQEILISPTFPLCSINRLKPLGAHRLRDYSEDWEVYTLSNELDPECVGCLKNVSEVDATTDASSAF